MILKCLRRLEGYFLYTLLLCPKWFVRFEGDLSIVVMMVMLIIMSQIRTKFYFMKFDIFFRALMVLLLFSAYELTGELQIWWGDLMCNSYGFYCYITSIDRCMERHMWCVAVSTVIGWQEDNILVVHFIGAVMAFGGAGVYCWMQAILSYKMSNLPKSQAWCRLTRVILSVVHAICFFISILWIIYWKTPLQGQVMRCQPQEWQTWCRSWITLWGIVQVESHQWLTNWYCSGHPARRLVLLGQCQACCW